jgi:hypothetical protein
MSLYERRKGGKTVERVQTVPRKFEDTRLGLMAMEREKAKDPDGWYLVDETKPAPAAKPAQDNAGG